MSIEFPQLDDECPVLTGTSLGRFRGLYMLNGKLEVSGEPVLKELCGLLSLPSIEEPDAPSKLR
jgi:hypothetical protein